MDVVKYVLIIYSWVIVGVLVFFLWRIARFYEETSGQHVGYYALFLALLLLATGVVWYLVNDVDFIGQPAGDLLLFSGGIVLFLFGNHLRELMTGEQG
ncbi:MAG TPA: hypothetical protein G4N99_09475 [Thermoflexia bacterium]|nr:hypothetical protein [Thermoflexia bacterium]